ncbi:MAG: hypothetical protein AAF724_03340 [Pseudomonadota bacterium]
MQKHRQFRGRLSAAAVIGAVFVVVSGLTGTDDPIDRDRHLQLASVAAVIASAVAHLDRCIVKPLFIGEIADGKNDHMLLFTGKGDEVAEGSAIGWFKRLGDCRRMQSGFGYAG